MTSYAGAGRFELHAESLKGDKALNDDPVTDEEGRASSCCPLRHKTKLFPETTRAGSSCICFEAC